jgi:hypothetical protein
VFEHQARGQTSNGADLRPEIERFHAQMPCPARTSIR